MKMSPTSDVTIAPNAAPMMTPTARSTTLPRMANFLNSSSIALPFSDRGYQVRVCLGLYPVNKVNGTCEWDLVVPTLLIAADRHGPAQVRGRGNRHILA